MSTETKKRVRPPMKVKIPKEDLAAFKRYLKTFATQEDAQADCSISRNTIRDLQVLKTCSPATLDKIKAVIEKQKAA